LFAPTLNDAAAARRFFERAIDLHDVPEKITIDRSGANTAAVRGLVADSGTTIELRQSPQLNNLRRAGSPRRQEANSADARVYTSCRGWPVCTCGLR